MNKKQFALIILIAFFVGSIGSLFFGRWALPALATVRGFAWVNKLVTNAPIIVNRREEVQLNEGVNLIDLIKQSGNITVSLYNAKNVFLGNGLILTSDGLIMTATGVLQNLTQVNVVAFDGQKFTGTVKLKDAKSGIALLSVVATNLSAAQFDQAADLVAGQRVIFIGRTSTAFEHAAWTGFVTQSLKNQSEPKQVATDATVSGDYFGGPIINLSGHVVGLVVNGNQNIIAEDLQTILNSYLTSNKK